MPFEYKSIILTLNTNPDTICAITGLRICVRQGVADGLASDPPRQIEGARVGGVQVQVYDKKTRAAIKIIIFYSLNNFFVLKKSIPTILSNPIVTNVKIFRAVCPPLLVAFLSYQ